MLDPEATTPSVTSPAVREWTGDTVSRLFIAAFRQLPGTPVYSSRGRLSDLRELEPGPLQVLNWAERYRERDLRTALLVWASAMTRGDPNRSISSIVAEHGWARATFEGRRRRAAAIIAKSLIRDGVPPFGLPDQSEVDTRRAKRR